MQNEKKQTSRSRVGSKPIEDLISHSSISASPPLNDRSDCSSASSFWSSSSLRSFLREALWSFLKHSSNADEHGVSSRSRVSLLSRLHSRRSTSPSVSDHGDDFEGARDPNTFSTRARKLSSTDSEDAIEGEGEREGDFLRFSFGVFCVCVCDPYNKERRKEPPVGHYMVSAGCLGNLQTLGFLFCFFEKDIWAWFKVFFFFWV